MSLKLKACLIFLGIFFLWGAIDYTLQQFVILPSFASLEDHEARKDLDRVVETLKSEIQHLDTVCGDWSAWDDTYEFVGNLNEKYVDSNLVTSTFTDGKINLIYFVNRNGDVVWGQIRNCRTGGLMGEMELGPDFSATIRSFEIEEKDRGESWSLPLSGLISTKKGPMMLSAQPILTSEEKGPVRGTLIMGRLLNQTLIKALENQSKVSFKIREVEKKSPHGTAYNSSTITPPDYEIRPADPGQLRIQTIVPGLTGRSDFLVAAVIPRTIFEKGVETSHYALFMSFASYALILAAMLFVLQWTILRPIIKLRNHTLNIGKTGNLSVRLKMKNKDEIGSLANEFDTMVEKLQKRNEKVSALHEEMKRDMARRIKVEAALRESEEKRFRSRKMESLGLMAGGIAHDLNNILSGVVSYPELILMDLPEDSPLRKPINTILESGLRAADVVADLLTIAKGIAADKEVRNLNNTVAGYLNSGEHMKIAAAHPLIQVETELDPSLHNIKCSPVHLEKTLMNLTVNAMEAIENRGKVTISTSNCFLDKPLRGYDDVHCGPYVVLRVHDNGVGISPEDIDRIFEPFYTRKVMGRSGTGLGLTVVWNTVHEHDGYIRVASDERGTMFELYFPVSQVQNTGDQQSIPMTDTQGNGEKILVVDDESVQREIACEILVRLGYHAEAVSSGEAAIEFVKDNAVDLVVLDMLMPKGMNGLETYEKMRTIQPDLKAIIASGYSETEAVKKAQKLGAGKYIKKPYTLKTLGLTVKGELKK